MKRLITFTLSILLTVFVNFAAEEDEYQPQTYDNAKVVRVKYSEGETYVKRSYEDGLEEATTNLSVFEKDTVGTTAGRLELYLGRLNYIRLDNDSEILWEKAPALRQTNFSVRVLNGSVYLDIVNIDHEKDIEVQTPDCGIFVLSRGKIRINVGTNGGTEVSVFEGMAEIAGDDYNRNLKENQKIVMAGGKVQERPFYFYASDRDDFDSWNEKRDRDLGYSRTSSNRYLEAGYEDYESELSRSGRWQFNNTYNSYTWIPYSLNNDWRPYSNGRWVWHPHYGYVWDSYDSWGWFTHHYGRWSWDPFYGWCWIPAYHWSPAWVYWCWNDDYYCWSPLSYWNRPIIIINNRWDRHYRDWRHMPWHSRSTIVIKKSHLSSANIRRISLRDQDLKNIEPGKALIAKRGIVPSMKPETGHMKVVNSRGKTVVYKNGGVVNLKNAQPIDKKDEPTKKPGVIHKTDVNRDVTTGDKPPKIYTPKKTAQTNEPGVNPKSYRKTGTTSAPKSVESEKPSKGKSGGSTGNTATSSHKSSSKKVIKKKGSETPGMTAYNNTTTSTGNGSSQGYNPVSSEKPREFKRYTIPAEKDATASPVFYGRKIDRSYTGSSSYPVYPSKTSEPEPSPSPSVDSRRSYKSFTSSTPATSSSTPSTSPSYREYRSNGTTAARETGSPSYSPVPRVSQPRDTTYSHSSSSHSSPDQRSTSSSSHSDNSRGYSGSDSSGQHMSSSSHTSSSSHGVRKKD